MNEPRTFRKHYVKKLRACENRFKNFKNSSTVLPRLLIQSLNPRSRQPREANKRRISNTLVLFFFFLFLTLQHSLLLEDFFYDPFSSVYKFALSLLKVLLLVLIIKNKKSEGKNQNCIFQKGATLLNRSIQNTLHVTLHKVYTNLGTGLVGRLYVCETEIDFILTVDLILK